MSNIQGYERFEKFIADFVPKYIGPIYKAYKEDKEEYLNEHDLEYLIFNGFTEITASLENIKLSQLLISLVPPNSKKINQSDYLKYHIHMYLQEIYILKERLNKYATKIQRKYKKHMLYKNQIDINTFMEPLFSLVKITLESIVDVRGNHVHTERFTDDDLNWLASTTLLAKFHEEYKLPAKLAYKTAKNKWSLIIKSNTEEINKIIDTYFDTIFTIITIDEKLVLPKSSK